MGSVLPSIHLPDFQGANDDAQFLGNVTPNVTLTSPSNLLDSAEFSRLIDKPLRAAQRALKSGRFDGSEIDVQAVPSKVGRGGIVRMVNVDSLTADLRAKYYLQFGIDINAQKVGGWMASMSRLQEAMDHDPQYDVDRKTANWRLNIIRPILGTKARSAERGQLINKIADDGVIGEDGQRQSVTKVSLYNWVKKYEAKGLNGLIRKKRNDSKKQRVIVTQKWDQFFTHFGISEADHSYIGDEIRAHIAGLWAAGAAGWSVVSEQAATRLIEMSRVLNVPEFDAVPVGNGRDQSTTHSQFGLCRISRRMAELQRKASLIAIKDKDNAQFQDKFAASIRRDYSSLSPREIVVGDVHPVDIMMRRPDGSVVYPKAISWMDPSTNEIHMTFVLCEKSEGIRREHVAQSFEAMVDAWGLPKLLYLDNGSEYKWAEMIDGFTMLSKLAGRMSVFDLNADKQVSGRVEQARESVIRSLAYNAKGKPKIEGAFGNIEQVFFSTIKGWTAGDRMNKKTHLKGRDPMAFDGDAHDFLETASKALQWYHRRPQNGRLAGRSPNEALGDFIEDGWGKTVLARKEVMALAFATTETRVVDRGVVQFTPRKIQGQNGGTIRFYHDDLLMLTGKKITLKIPAFNPEYVFCFDGPDLVCIATPEKSYHPLDIAGAKEGSRRNQYLRRAITELREHCALLSLTEETDRHIGHLPEAPEIPVAQTVRVGVLERMAALQDKTRAALADEEAGEPEREFVQFGQRNADNPLIKDVTFLEEDE